MTTNAVARISRISFLTDMTRAGTPVIPVGYLLEGAWGDDARWLGLIGRARFTPAELDHVDFNSWPEFRTPLHLLAGLFEGGWEAAWGTAGDTLQEKWGRSALEITVSDRTALIADKSIASEADWQIANQLLLTDLLSYEAKLVPLISAPVLAFPAAKTGRQENAINKQIMTDLAAVA